MSTQCNGTTDTTSASSQSTTAASVGSAKSSKISTIVGAVIGSVSALVVAAAVVIFRLRKRQRRLDSLHVPEAEVISPYIVPDSTSGNQGSGHDRKRAPSTPALVVTVSGNGQTSLDLWNESSSIDALRHEDAGAVPTLTRSWSGRLPPAYDPVWEAPR
ncbi:hypothetical protein K503DRAFT_803866 [Rhizopogon vinicolor AM-OR11-026]|uniref:Uncharacterized protein n=1 Tax=Rhizopogon vinicolor AM-OR11-026 TaxID=1314800 RepID=A0A1B7MNC6_9AGAM|nr:hypothetical protein K503DRAFT_803866 [Rhizopogon vinicolor AM-OR11-026]